MSSSEEKRKPRILPRKDGPFSLTLDYEESSRGCLKNSRGEEISIVPQVSLCRCGASKKKPFCDGSHVRIGFSGERLTDGRRNKRRDYVGKKITIHDNRAICSHSEICIQGLPSVFKKDGRPWIDADGAEAEAIIDIVRRCPSGALSYSIDGVEHRDLDREPSLTVSKNGPYCVEGGIELAVGEDAWGEEASKEHYTLCRCGASENKPFCDGKHWDVNFEDEDN